MSLIDDVKILCDRLASLGWRNLLLTLTDNTLDITQPTTAKLQTELTKTVSINRSLPGFQDFNPTGTRAITAGQPAQSLLYHALASPNVHPTGTSLASAKSTDYPSLAELDILENFIYSLAANRTDLTGSFIAVFAYQYRVASRTTHLRHADFAYSRTGIARIGTATAQYSPSRRSFWLVPETDPNAIGVLPARYGVFLARRAKPGTGGTVQGSHNGLRDSDFIFPLHKLFNGNECLTGRNLNLAFMEFHRNEKLRKLHTLAPNDGGLPVPLGFDINKAPYVRDSKNGANLVSLQPVGSSVLLVPTPGNNLVRTVTQHNTVSNSEQTVYFTVPKAQTVRNRTTRFTTSTLEIPAFGEDRLAPEYVNIRHAIDPNAEVNQPPNDLNQLNSTDFANKMTTGDYAAAHFVDDSADGCVEAIISGLDASLENLPAFSLVTAPDFFPLANQFAIEQDSTIIQVDPLSKGRLPVNPNLPRPSNPTAFAFNRNDKTVTAIVGGLATGSQTTVLGHSNRMVSFLPDAASNVFAPGWDTSRSRDALGAFLTSSGLGSPFPEDAKLCAALASFWPAVAPDNGRTFGNQGFGNQLPMLDEELGFHPNHERVLSGEVTSYTGWDGEYGPFFERIGPKLTVNYVTIERSDYVSNSLANKIRVSLTAEVQTEDLIARHQALNQCGHIQPIINEAAVCLVVVRKVENWANVGRGSNKLNGGGFVFEFAELQGRPQATSELARVRREVRKRHIFQVGSNGIAYKNGSAAFVFV